MTRALPQPSRAARRGKTNGLSARFSLTAMTVGVALAVALSGGSIAIADDESDKATVDAAITAQQQTIDTLKQHVIAAQAAKDQAHTALGLAQAELAKAQAGREQANTAHLEAQAKLATAKAELAKAKDDAARGKAEVETQVKRNGGIARAIYSGQTPLMSVAIVAQATSVSNLQDRMRWTAQVFEVQGGKLNDLHDAQQRLETAEKHQTELEQQATKAEQDSAQALAASKAAEEAAVTTQARLDSASKQADQADTQANEAVSQAQQLLSQQQAQSAQLEQQIKERIAAQEAERLRQLEKAPSHPVIAPDPVVPPAVSDATSSWGLMWPVNGPLTSAYGWRLDPVTGSFSALHNGQDIAAGCGTAVRAPASGTVTKQFWDGGGGGNYLMMDNGRINGSYITTGFAHLQSYAVGVGTYVNQGDVIAYVGTTGWSTGCHLHFMLFNNGTMTDPVPYMP
ncbi:MAG: peptidoglycan DD-metalloendopeptidase family protein [Propionibacteriaceae bacterium]